MFVKLHPFLHLQETWKAEINISSRGLAACDTVKSGLNIEVLLYCLLIILFPNFVLSMNLSDYRFLFSLGHNASPLCIGP